MDQKEQKEKLERLDQKEEKETQDEMVKRENLVYLESRENQELED